MERSEGQKLAVVAARTRETKYYSNFELKSRMSFYTRVISSLEAIIVYVLFICLLVQLTIQDNCDHT